MNLRVEFQENSKAIDVVFQENHEEIDIELGEIQRVSEGFNFTTDETLSFEGGVLSVNTAKEVEADNTLPVTSAAVQTAVGNIEILLSTI